VRREKEEVFSGLRDPPGNSLCSSRQQSKRQWRWRSGRSLRRKGRRRGEARACRPERKRNGPQGLPADPTRLHGCSGGSWHKCGL